MQFLKFAAVGTIAFVIDAGVTSGLTHFGVTPWLARIPAFLAANLVNYALNRRWTFRHDIGFWRGWPRYIASSAVGMAVNYAVYSAVLLFVPHTPTTVIGAVAIGSIVAMAVNYFTAKRFVFR